MQRNEHKNIFKLNDKSITKAIFSAQLCNQSIPNRKYFKKLQTKEISGFDTQPVTRKNSPQLQDRRYHVKSGFNLHRKYINKDQNNSKQKNDKSVNSVFKRRVNSQSKASKSKILIQNQSSDSRDSKLKINFAKKIIEDLKKQTFKLKKQSSRYSQKSNNSKSEQQSDKKLMNRQKLIRNSMQKLKPSFNINEVKFYSSKKSLGQLSKQSKVQNRSGYINKSRQKTSRLQERISLQISKQNLTNNNQYLNKMLKKVTQPLYSYSEYIKSSGQIKYQIKLQFLTQYLTIKQKQDIMAHIDFHSLKLLESIYLCMIDIFSIHVQEGKNKQIKFFNYDIVREYTGVYFQTYSKIKTQYILCEVIFKTLKKKLSQFFLMQRFIFYFISQLCAERKIIDDIGNLKKIVNFLKLSEQILAIILSMLFEDNKNIKVSQDNIIDTFKSLQLTRELDKRLPSLKQIVFSLNLHHNEAEQGSFTNLSCSLLGLLSNFQKQQNIDIIIIFKLEQYFNWNTLMIPPLFYLPMSPSKPYTLVIDLDGTLIYYNEDSRILKYRPYMDRFLAAMQKHFQLIIYSSHPKQRTDIIIKQIQRDEHIFSYRLYKAHMVFQQGSLRKNVGYLGRNLQKLVFIDDEQKNTQWLPSNSFRIKTYTGDKQDKQLLNLTDWLINLIETQPADVRGKIKKPQQFLDQILEIDEVSSTIQPSIEYLEGNQINRQRKNH